MAAKGKTGYIEQWSDDGRGRGRRRQAGGHSRVSQSVSQSGDDDHDDDDDEKSTELGQFERDGRRKERRKRAKEGQSRFVRKE